MGLPGGLPWGLLAEPPVELLEGEAYYRYGDKVYPRGRYRARRIVLGEGKGHNWWCVMFPPLCIAETDNGEIDINKLELKSWIIEKLKSIDGGKLWEKLMSRLG